jgi:virginiamycin B lyase
VIEPPMPRQGARRIWSDSQGALWISKFLAGQIARFDPGKNTLRSWHLSGARPQPYGVYVDQHDVVWVSDFGAGRCCVSLSGTGQFSRVAGQRSDVWI